MKKIIFTFLVLLLFQNTIAQNESDKIELTDSVVPIVEIDKLFPEPFNSLANTVLAIDVACVN